MTYELSCYKKTPHFSFSDSLIRALDLLYVSHTRLILITVDQTRSIYMTYSLSSAKKLSYICFRDSVISAVERAESQKYNILLEKGR